MAEKKYYWLKLKEDFFEQDDIKLLEGIPNGKDYIIFYLKLLCKSLKDGGNLRYKGVFPYTPEMLASITGTNIDIVHGAIEKFKALSMIDVLDDGALFMLDVENMTGQETAAAERMRRKRAKEINSVTMLQECSEKFIDIDIDIEKDKEIDKEIEKSNRTRFTPPTLEDVKSYCLERNNNVDAERFIDYYTSNGWMVGKNKMKDWKAAVRTWEKSGYNNIQKSATNQPKKKEFNFIPTGVAESGEEYMEIDGKWFNRYGKELNSKGYEIIDFGLSKGW